MKKSLGILLFVLFLLVGCSAAPKAADAAEACALNTDADVNDNGVQYSVNRSAESGTGVVTEDFTDMSLVYVTFSEYSDSFTADDGTKLFTSQCYVPEFVTEDEDLDNWLTSCVNDAAARTMNDLVWTRERAQADYPEREEGMFYTYSYYSNVNTERLDNEIISVLQVNSTYSGGAHPNYSQHAYNLDLASSRRLTLSDVIEPDGEAVLLDMVLAELKSRFDGLEGLGLFPDYQLIVQDCLLGPELTSNWYFSDNGLVIYFNCYEIAPYAAGIIKVEFAYDTLRGVLRTDYLPVSADDGEGSVILLDSPEGLEVLSQCSEGERIYISADSIIYDVKVYRISSWLADEIPIVGPMVFAANRLTWYEAVEIGDVAMSWKPSYLVSFRSDGGQMKTVAVGNGILHEIVSETAE